MTKFNDCRAPVICSSLITRFTILRVFVEMRQTSIFGTHTFSRQYAESLKTYIFTALSRVLRILGATIKFKRTPIR